jgi:hypothetical protein
VCFGFVVVFVVGALCVCGLGRVGVVTVCVGVCWVVSVGGRLWSVLVVDWLL